MRVLLTGATGFIGARLFEALLAQGHSVNSVVRNSADASPGAVIGDLRSVDLRPHVDTADVVVHAATTTTGTASDLWAGNVLTTERVAAAVGGSGARLLYLSTTGVYGRSFGRFGDAALTRRQPSSPLSIARAAAEDVVLAAGGTVIRPHVVHGQGDRWIAPRLAAFMLEEDAWLGAADVEVAAITTERLAQGIVALLERPTLPPALHAAERRPKPVAELVAPYFRSAGRSLPSRVLSIDDALMRLGAWGMSRNALSMLGRSSSADSDAFWGEPARQASPHPLARCPQLPARG
ncbi:NAD(P)-dependent oxidoreductase [Curtobacterium sp. RHCJP20]|uniref:NAD(P)-dependent oxidoreductase n=1 Tax=Curtobacterium subtropicum TaxID=3055138 RepID=A0ABT7TDP4_9MICO|nr:NAD(P)-dependent oxidoreductase [Curtobacterium subtropicum]MDM7887697.1 NAD(P)-dependent oxidoreductase [Curtobacterium subtropicum]